MSTLLYSSGSIAPYRTRTLRRRDEAPLLPQTPANPSAASTRPYKYKASVHDGDVAHRTRKIHKTANRPCIWTQNRKGNPIWRTGCDLNATPERGGGTPAQSLPTKRNINCDDGRMPIALKRIWRFFSPHFATQLYFFQHVLLCYTILLTFLTDLNYSLLS